MKKALLLCGALLALGAPAALASGVNLTWTDASGGCWSDGVQVANRSFACNTNAGSVTMCGSFLCDLDHPGFQGIQVVLDGGTSDASAVPDWWQLFTSGACRQTDISSSAEFSTAPGVGCTDPWKGLAVGGITAWETALFPPAPPANTPSPDRMRMRLAYALPQPSPIAAYAEYYGFKVSIDFQKTLGAGACAGCAAGVTFWLIQIRETETTGASESMTVALPGGNQCLTYNGSTRPCTWVPTRSTTWGQVQAMYR